MSPKILNVPNTLSLVRVFLAPLVLLFLSLRISAPVPFLSLDGAEPLTLGDLLAAVVFIIAAITDSMDGYIARQLEIGRASCRERV